MIRDIRWVLFVVAILSFWIPPPCLASERSAQPPEQRPPKDEPPPSSDPTPKKPPLADHSKYAAAPSTADAAPSKTKFKKKSKKTKHTLPSTPSTAAPAAPSTK